MTVATPTAPAQTLAPVGRLRRARIGTRLQALGRGLSNLAAAGFVVLLIGAAAFDALWIYSEPVPLGEQGYAIGLGFPILALFLGIAAPWRVKPRRVDGSWARAVAAQPAFPRKVRRELHGAELYRARLYVPSFVAVAVLWVVTAVAYYLAFREERADPDVTMHAGYWVAVGLIVAGFVAVLLMIPWGSRRTVLVDDEGSFFADPGSPNPPASAEPVAQAQPVAAMPPVAAAVEPVAFAPPEAAAQPPTAVPSPVPSPPATTAERDVSGRGRMALGAVVGVLVTVLVLVGAAAFYVLRGGEARSPSEVADLFGQAKVKCMDFDVITDSRATKTLGCRTDDVQIITVTTYGNVPDGDEWLADRCEASQGEAARLRRGYYLRGDDFILDMHQLRHPKFVKPTPIERTSARLGRVLDASVVRYNCNAQ